MKAFVKVPNEWYKINKDNMETTFIGELGKNRFTLWFLLKANSVRSNSNAITIQIKSLHAQYKHLLGFGKPANIKKLLLDLKKINLIECDILNENSKPSILLNIKLIEPNYKNGFQKININLFFDKIDKLQPLGFFIYCFLYYGHNAKLGNDIGSVGYAEYSSEFISEILSLNRKTVLKGIDNIKKAKNLIKVIPKKSYNCYNKFNENIFKTQPPRYIIKAKYDCDNKYFIPNT